MSSVFGDDAVADVNYKRMVSLGISCQTAHQLRRLESSQPDADISSEVEAPPSLFDWLICPSASAVELLNKRFPEFTRSSIAIYKGRPYWSDFNIYFWHSFLFTEGGARTINIDATFERELRRWRFLCDRFSALDPTDTVFVISNTQNNLETEVFEPSERDQYHFTDTGMNTLRDSLAKYFHTDADNIELQIITRENRSCGLTPNAEVSFLPVDQNEWKGSKQSWNKWWQQLNQSLADQH